MEGGIGVHGTCAHVCICVWRPEVDVSYFSDSFKIAIVCGFARTSTHTIADASGDQKRVS